MVQVSFGTIGGTRADGEDLNEEDNSIPFDVCEEIEGANGNGCSGDRIRMLPYPTNWVVAPKFRFVVNR